MDECTDEEALEYFLKVRGYTPKRIAVVKERQKRILKNPAGKNPEKQITSEEK